MSMKGILLTLSLVCWGCKVAPPVSSVEDRVHPQEDISATTQQARLRIRALVLPLSGAIIESADRISAATNDHAIRRAALVWKLEAVPALREALFRPNPFTAIGDAWERGTVHVPRWRSLCRCVLFLLIGEGRELPTLTRFSRLQVIPA